MEVNHTEPSPSVRFSRDKVKKRVHVCMALCSFTAEWAVLNLPNNDKSVDSVCCQGAAWVPYKFWGIGENHKSPEAIFLVMCDPSMNEL
jgi:hypothetical protein